MAILGYPSSKVTTAFGEHVLAGLSAKNKYLSSRYFYDAQGDRIFQAIMAMPEYYLTASEHEIFSTRGKDILNAFEMRKDGFELVEFGAGDGTKTKVLIEKLLQAGGNFRYIPIDISGDVLNQLKKTMQIAFPELEVTPENAEYFQALENISKISGRAKLVLFIGSSIGNFMEAQALNFLKSLNNKLKPGDKVLFGFDLQKDPKTILDAYNDPQGITRNFNLNLLTRINKELGGHFDLGNFDHYPLYDPQSGLAKSFIVSKISQEVEIQALKTSFHFSRGEVIHTEISQKYTIEDITSLFERTGFEIDEHFFDCKHYYVDTLATKK